MQLHNPFNDQQIPLPLFVQGYKLKVAWLCILLRALQREEQQEKQGREVE